MEDMEILWDIIHSFVSSCDSFIFCSIVTRRYVGTSGFDKTQIITDVEEALFCLKVELKVRG